MSDSKGVIERPIQILLNTKEFMERPERPGGGQKKDFFWKRDFAFKKHKSEIRQNLFDAAEEISNMGVQEGFLVVQMRDEALAKSHRPVRSMFSPKKEMPLIGGGRVGEMFFQCSSGTVIELANDVDKKAENESTSRYDEKSGKEKANPSAFRADLSGIDKIRAYGASDRIKFSAQDAVNWLRKDNVFGGYILELFRPDFVKFGQQSQALFDHLKSTLEETEGGIIVRPLSDKANTGKVRRSFLLSVRLIRNPTQRSFAYFGEADEKIGQVQLDTDIRRHDDFLRKLSAEPLVRNVGLPLEVSSTPSMNQRSELSLPPGNWPEFESNSPTVGIIDGGVAECEELQDWCIGKANYVKEEHQEYHHGTFIAGLLVGARNINPSFSDKLESVACKFFDIALMPRKGLLGQYYRDQGDFLDQLEEEIIEAKSQYGIRVYNISLGMPGARNSSSYSMFAAALDRIALDHDVIFVVSAGNLNPHENRPPWPLDPTDAISMVAAYSPSDDRVTSPGEHLMGLTVGALNPPKVSGHVHDMPTCYTRRGPGVAGTRKPDIAHYGGVSKSDDGTGLVSLGVDGCLIENNGTSFATPNVAASLAAIDFSLAGAASRETLLALLIHRAERSKHMKSKKLQNLARDFVGYGRPISSNQILIDSLSSITLTFSENLNPRNELAFNFSWPPSLITSEGKCKGSVELTLVYSPPIDPDYDDECLRVQLDAQLQQLNIDPESGDEKPTGTLKLYDSSLPSGLNHTENYMLRAGLKWTPIKRYALNMPNGRGNSSTWRLKLTGSSRVLESFPRDGVPFSIIMTISDPGGTAPVYEELRNGLIRTGVQLEDIAVAHRVRASS